MRLRGRRKLHHSLDTNARNVCVRLVKRSYQLSLSAFMTNMTVNPLTTNDNYSRHRNLATCYQLAQFVLKISSALAERVERGEAGECHSEDDSAR